MIALVCAAYVGPGTSPDAYASVCVVAIASHPDADENDVAHVAFTGAPIDRAAIFTRVGASPDTQSRNASEHQVPGTHDANGLGTKHATTAGDDATTMDGGAIFSALDG
jgi:hypothetical protein